MTTVSTRSFLFVAGLLLATALPIEKEDVQTEIKTIDVSNSTDDSPKDILVIKTIVYEVGILTEADNSTDNSTQVHQQVDLTFFDPAQNGSTIDLSNIPLPIQTNVSGVTVTGVAPTDLGTILLPEGNESAILNTVGANFPLLPNAIISVKHNISTLDNEKSAQILSAIPELLGLSSPLTGQAIKLEVVPNTTNGNDETKSEIPQVVPLGAVSFVSNESDAVTTEKVVEKKSTDAITTEKDEEKKTIEAVTTEKVEEKKTTDAVTTEKAEEKKTTDAVTTEKVEAKKTIEAVTTEKVEAKETIKAVTTEKVDEKKTTDAVTTDNLEENKTIEAVTTEKIEEKKTTATEAKKA